MRHKIFSVPVKRYLVFQRKDNKSLRIQFAVVGFSPAYCLEMALKFLPDWDGVCIPSPGLHAWQFPGVYRDSASIVRDINSEYSLYGKF